jgi:hypothetical protein
VGDPRRRPQKIKTALRVAEADAVAAVQWQRGPSAEQAPLKWAAGSTLEGSDPASHSRSSGPALSLDEYRTALPLASLCYGVLAADRVSHLLYACVMLRKASINMAWSKRRTRINRPGAHRLSCWLPSRTYFKFIQRPYSKSAVSQLAHTRSTSSSQHNDDQTSLAPT